MKRQHGTLIGVLVLTVALFSIAMAVGDYTYKGTAALTLADTSSAGILTIAIDPYITIPIYGDDGKKAWTALWRKLTLLKMDSTCLAHNCSLNVIFSGWDGTTETLIDSVTLGDVSIDSSSNMAKRLKLDSIAGLWTADAIRVKLKLITKPARKDTLLVQASYAYPVKIRVRITGRY